MTPTIITDLVLHHENVTVNTTWSFIQVTLANGLSGWGEATWNKQPQALNSPFLIARDLLIGRDINTLKNSYAPTPLTISSAAIKSALEQIWWDLTGKLNEISSCQLLTQPVRKAIPLYANINRGITTRDPSGFGRAAKLAEDSDFTQIKIAPFDGVTAQTLNTPEGKSLLSTGLERIAAVRASLQPQSSIYVDCHWRLDEKTTKAIIKELASLGVNWLECPLPETLPNIKVLKEIRHQANNHGIRLAGLEELIQPEAFIPWLKGGAYDVVMPDVKYAGGIQALLDIAEMANHYGSDFAPHNPSGPISHAASLIACAQVGNLDCLEYQFNETPRFWQMLDERFPKPAAGMNTLSELAGLGGGVINLA